MQFKLRAALLTIVCLMAFAGSGLVWATSARLAFEPSEVKDVASGATFTMNVTLADVSELFAWQANITFNPQVLNVESVVEGPFLKQIKETVFMERIENTRGFLGVSSMLNVPYPEHGASGSGVLCTITFSVKSGGSSFIQFNAVGTKLNTVIGGNRVSITDFTTADGSFGTPESGGLGGLPLDYIAAIVVVVLAVVGISFFFLRRRK